MYNVKRDFKEKMDFCKSFINVYNKKDSGLINLVAFYRAVSELKELSFYKIIDVKYSNLYPDEKFVSLIKNKEFEKLSDNIKERNEIFTDLVIFVNTFMSYIDEHKIINKSLVDLVISFATKVIENLITIDKEDGTSLLNTSVSKYGNFLTIMLEIFDKEEIELFANGIGKLFSLNYKNKEYHTEFLVMPIQNECLKKSLGLNYEKDIRKILSVNFNYEMYIDRFCAVSADIPTMFRTIASGVNYLYGEKLLNPASYYGDGTLFTFLQFTNKNDLKMFTFLIGKYRFVSFKTIINDEFMPLDYILTNDMFEEYKKNTFRFTFLYIYYFSKYNSKLFNKFMLYYLSEEDDRWYHSMYTVREFLLDNMFDKDIDIDELLKNYLDEKQISKLKEIVLSLKIDMDI